ncbi:MAG: SprB repeat-containing protein [Flavobacteriales bacterium]|nr:SprB repeat-containing protein [Flavobacteriales bacterium]
MFRKILFSLALGAAALNTHATHFSGGEIYWDCLGNNQYLITMVVYRDCAGINVDPNVTLQLQSPCGNSSVVVSTPGGTEISQLCGAELPNSTCNGGSLPGIEQYIYTATVTLAPCDYWTISYTNIYRNNAIVNLQNPGTQRTYIRATINTLAMNPCNDSPQFSNTAIPYVCMGYPITYSFGAYDPEGDSLSYTLIDAMGINGAPIPYVAPNTGLQPIPGLTLDPVTGQVNFILNTQGNWVVVVQVNHYVNGVLVGTIMRDMQFVAYPCGNDPPDPTTGLIQNLSGTAVQLGPRAIQVCESGNFCFDFVISDPNLPNVLDAFSNIGQNLPGATFTFNGFNPITCTVCWNATPNTSGFFPFIVNVDDGACPIPAFQTYVYSVTVIPGLYGGITTTNEACVGTGNGTATASVTAGTAPFTYAWNTGATTPSITGPSGSYTVTMTDANNCVSPPYTGVINVTSQPNIANAGPDAIGCVASGAIALNGSVTNATGGAWSGGAGVYSGAWPNIGYTPTSAEINTGSMVQTLTTTGNGGCPPDTDSMVLTLVNSFANVTVSPTNALCNGGATGSATVSPATPGFTYAWNTNPVQSLPTAINLTAGNYSVTITDGFNCQTTLTTTVGQPAAVTLANLISVDETCAGSGNGGATATGGGGTAPYSYTWSNGATGPTIIAGAGSYTVSVTDANGCIPATGIATISAAAQPNQANAGADLVGCIGSFPIALSGTVVNATGGSWSGGTGSFTGAWPNVSYTPSASDILNNGATLTLNTVGNTNCPSVSDQVFINIPNSFANASVTPTDALCFGASNGSVSFSPTTPGFSYAWNTNPVQTGPTASGACCRQLHRYRNRQLWLQCHLEHHGEPTQCARSRGFDRGGRTLRRAEQRDDHSDCHRRHAPVQL